MACHCLVERGSNTKVKTRCAVSYLQCTHAPAAHYARGDGSGVLCGATQASINDLIYHELVLQVQMATFFHDVAQALGM
jgi:hypothetical protein